MIFRNHSTVRIFAIEFYARWKPPSNVTATKVMIFWRIEACRLPQKKRPVRGTTARVFCMNDKNITVKLKKIPSFTEHNAQFWETSNGKAFKIGAGKLIAWNEIIFCPQEATCLGEEKLFLPISAQEMDKTTTHYGRVDDVSGIFKYLHPPCSKEFLWNSSKCDCKSQPSEDGTERRVWPVTNLLASAPPEDFTGF